MERLVLGAFGALSVVVLLIAALVLLPLYLLDRGSVTSRLHELY